MESTHRCVTRFSWAELLKKCLFLHNSTPLKLDQTAMCRYTFNPYHQKNPDWSGDSFAFLQNQDMLAFHQALAGYAPTPLQSLPALAQTLGVGQIWVKDESHRFGVKAFKALGASYAIYRFLKNRWEEQFPEKFDAHIFCNAAALKKLGDFTFCAATDGNHGKAVAWTAKMIQQKAVIFMPAETAQARIDNIHAEGGKVQIVRGTYDDCVMAAAQTAKKQGWIEIADTAYEGYTVIPSWVLNGYSTLFREIEATFNAQRSAEIDLVFLQAGVGAFAAAGAAHYTMRYGENRPKLICLEPLEAAGFLDSINEGQGHPIPAKGKMETIMAGLNCGTPSLAAWPILKDSIDLFLGIGDGYAEEAMKEYAQWGVVAGESGASGLAALLALLQAPSLAEAKEKIGLNAQSRILLINTEGDTDPQNYQKIVGLPVPSTAPSFE